jgi:hypothetical protein
MKATFFEEMSPVIEWNELARKICKRNEENKITDKQVLDEINDAEDDDYDEDEQDDGQSDEDDDIEFTKVKIPAGKKAVPSTKAPKEKSTVKPKSTTSVPPSIVDSDNENEESEADDDYDYNEDNNEEEDEDDEEDREDESISEKPDKNILFDGIQIIKKVENRIFGMF